MTKEITKWDKFPLFSSLQEDMNKMLDNFWRKSSLGMGWSPSIDIAETEDDITVKAEVPGLDPKEIDISITGNRLTIKGEKREEKENKEKFYHRIERSYGSFTRTIDLPVPVNVDKVEAKGNHGILEITLPKMEKEKGKKISVNVK